MLSWLWQARGVRGRGCAASQTESTDGGSRHGATQPPARDPPAHASLTPRSLQLHLSLRASPPRLASPLSRGSTSGSGIMGIKVVVMVLALTLLLSVVMAQPLLNEGKSHQCHIRSWLRERGRGRPTYGTWQRSFALLPSSLAVFHFIFLAISLHSSGLHFRSVYTGNALFNTSKSKKKVKRKKKKRK